MARKSSPSARRKRLMVIDGDGGRYPFLRGMVTHDLVRRGLPFDEAYAAAHRLRDRLADHEEIATGDLWQQLQEVLEELFGAEVHGRLQGEVPAGAELLRVTDQGQSQPFSRGLLARSMFAAGVDLDRAYGLVSRLQEDLASEGLESIERRELIRRTGQLLEELVGAPTASRYRLVRGIRYLPKPVVIYVAGTSGTGKSTLAVDLAPLLRIFRINATDTIRQVMRMVFSQAILPSLHRSSFEALPLEDGPWGGEENPSGGSEEARRRRVIAAYEEQASRVLVGVRGVVERSVAENTSIVVEGVHLLPGQVPIPELEGQAYQVMLLLTTPDEEVHRSRFLLRGPGRRGERYLHSFEAIRWIQEHLLDLADLHDVALLPTDDPDSMLPRALRLTSDLLRQKVPQLGVELDTPTTPALLLVIDGLADRPVRSLGNRTPLAAAHTPHLDRLAAEGRCGLADPIAPDVVADTAAGSLAILGQNPLAIRRGPVEALGAGHELGPEDVALRCNFASLDPSGVVVDRRAGRIRDEVKDLAKALDRMMVPGVDEEEVQFHVRSTTEHRLALVIRGEGLSSAIQGSDPGDDTLPCPPLTPRPLRPEDEAAVRTARYLDLFEQEARAVLQRHKVNRRRQEAGLPLANCIVSRGAGRNHRLIPLERAGLPLRLAGVGGDRTMLGLVHLLGGEVIRKKGMTASLDTDLGVKFRAAEEALEDHDLVVLHVKGADIAAHDGRPDHKLEFLERLDAALGEFLAARQAQGLDLRIGVTADHATLSESGRHSADPVPALLWGPGIEADSVESFDEVAGATGALGRFQLQLLTPRLVGA
ncbi:MAG: 2,3-bisphosphoglycerate-independent phosphoglycerate mutase [Acidobacteriota bacterium]